MENLLIQSNTIHMYLHVILTHKLPWSWKEHMSRQRPREKWFESLSPSALWNCPRWRHTHPVEYSVLSSYYTCPAQSILPVLLSSHAACLATNQNVGFFLCDLSVSSCISYSWSGWEETPLLSFGTGYSLWIMFSWWIVTNEDKLTITVWVLASLQSHILLVVIHFVQ